MKKLIIGFLCLLVTMTYHSQLEKIKYKIGGERDIYSFEDYHYVCGISDDNKIIVVKLDLNLNIIGHVELETDFDDKKLRDKSMDCHFSKLDNFIVFTVYVNQDFVKINFAYNNFIISEDFSESHNLNNFNIEIDKNEVNSNEFGHFLGNYLIAQNEKIAILTARGGGSTVGLGQEKLAYGSVEGYPTVDIYNHKIDLDQKKIQLSKRFSLELLDKGSRVFTVFKGILIKENFPIITISEDGNMVFYSLNLSDDSIEEKMSINIVNDLKIEKHYDIQILKVEEKYFLTIWHHDQALLGGVKSFCSTLTKYEIKDNFQSLSQPTTIDLANDYDLKGVSYHSSHYYIMNNTKYLVSIFDKEKTTTGDNPTTETIFKGMLVVDILDFENCKFYSGKERKLTSITPKKLEITTPNVLFYDNDLYHLANWSFFKSTGSSFEFYSFRENKTLENKPFEFIKKGDFIGIDRPSVLDSKSEFIQSYDESKVLWYRVTDPAANYENSVYEVFIHRLK